ncbi:hypothetical protein K3495_g9735 [Podosphaera aphanis]|nr:hypothetical protein K3495_g9735 [Podosphaera aphanis]
MRDKAKLEARRIFPRHRADAFGAMPLEHYPAPSMTERQRHRHLGFMRDALTMAEKALACAETPVGCVLVYDDHVIGRGMNDTNRSFNGTRHAELLALDDVLSQVIDDVDPYDPASVRREDEGALRDETTEHVDAPCRALRAPKKFTPLIFTQCTLYVTVEPCIMCASLLRQIGIRRVFFGAGNDKFGGTGGVLCVHQQNGAARDPAGTERRGTSSLDYEVSGGWLRKEAILLLRRFYVQENERAPEPRDKNNRILNLVVDAIEPILEGNPS